MTATRRTTTGDARLAACRRALVSAAVACAAACASCPRAAAQPPRLSLFCDAPNALVTGADTAEVYVKLFSWEEVRGPLEVRWRLTDGSGRGIASDSLTASSIRGQWVRRVQAKLPRYGPYVLAAGLYEPAGQKPLAEARLPLVRPVPVPRLTAEQRAASPIGVNTHFNAPWEALAKMGIHWARDYCWGWLGFGQTAPVASNQVDFARILAGAQAAGVTVLPCMQQAFRTDDKKRYLDDGARIAAAYERLSRAFPTIAFWELDNESDLQYRHNAAGWDAYWASYVNYIRHAAAGLRKAGKGANVALNGDAGIHYDRATRLLASAARDDFAVVNFHHYTGTVPPELSQDDADAGGVGTRTFLDELRRISRLAHAHGRQAWLTEVGWDATYGPAVGERVQAIYLARMYLLARFCGVDKVFWYFDRDTEGTGIFSSCGLLDRRQNARPAAAALAAVSKLTAVAAYAGSVDLGPDRWCLLFRDGKGQWLAAGWSVEREHPLPGPLMGAEAFDLFGNAAEPSRLTPEVTYFLPKQLPAGWDAQRQAELLSPTIMNVFPGAAAAVELRLPAGAKLAWQDAPAGVAPGEAKRQGGVVRARVACSPKAAIGRYALTAVAAGDGWRRAWPLAIHVLPPLRVASEPYRPGKPAKLRLWPNVDEAVEVELDLEAAAAGTIEPARLTVPPAGAAAQYTPSGEAGGPVKVLAKLKSGVWQTVTLRPAVLEVRPVEGIRLDGRLDDWPRETIVPGGAFEPSAGEFQPPMHLGWSPEGLYLAAELPASQLKPGQPRSFWECSNVELFVDVSGGAHRGWPASSHQFWFLPVREGGAWRALAGEWKRGDAVPATIYDDRRCKTAIRVEQGSFTMEMLVPASALGSAPAAGKSWRAAVTGQVTRPSKPIAMIAWPRAKRDGILDGSRFWGEMRFVGAAGGNPGRRAGSTWGAAGHPPGRITCSRGTS